MPVEFRLLSGEAIRPFIDDLARLRITVFKEYPYLYDGSPEYEAGYLDSHVRSAWSLCVLLLDEGRVVGASTGLPLQDEAEALQRPFLQQGWNPERIFYFGESVVLPEYRSTVLDLRFFEERERFTRDLKRFDWCAFCALQRSPGHPAKPAGYRTHDAFWLQRGFTPQPGLRAEYRWRDQGESSETAKSMVFWLKQLT
ncbi:GNAT family acetyltransferase [Pseudomonas pseudonitroreducens]|uniref:GNAT family acetyltransferase n=1 Tax=Pseudomonas pseudonitroreducens TaxID=2892326 RepID=UPI001F2D8527|nr:GNAT family acetyltransferase [Pseudomonas pseudonitroreducens]